VQELESRQCEDSSGVVVCVDTFDRWQDWHARAQVRQSFCTPGHTNRWEMSFAVSFVPRWPSPWRDSNTCRRWVSGMCGRGLVVDVSQCGATSGPGTWIFSNRRAVVPCKSAVSSAPDACSSAKASGRLKCRLSPRETARRRANCLVRRYAGCLLLTVICSPSG
jgi:hypothetical protein